MAILRGNGSEIANCLGESWEIKGVDAGDAGGDMEVLAQKAAQQFGTVAAITGKVDIVWDWNVSLYH